MISLVIDTCSKLTVLALIMDEKVVNQIIEKNDSSLSEKFSLYVEKLFSSSNIVPEQVDNIFVAVGPGSFTGIRVGVTFAKVMAWSLKKKVIPFSSLELIATTESNNMLVPIIDARRQSVYAGAYDNHLNNILKDQYITISCLKEKLNKYKDYDFISYDEFDFPTVTPKIKVEKIVENHINDVGVNPHILNPVYLKKTEAEEKMGHND